MLLFFIQELLSYYNCVLVVPNEGVLSKRARVLGIEVIVQCSPLLNSMYDPTEELWADLDKMKQQSVWNDLLQLLTSARPAVVITNTCINVLPAVAAKSLGIPVVWHITETMVINSNTHLSVSLIDQYSDWIIGISHSTMRSFHGEKIWQKIRILSPSWRMDELNPGTWGVSRKSKRKRLGLNDSNRLIGYISSFIHPIKGLYHFMKMALQICEKYPQTHFVILGKPMDEAYFESCIQLMQQSGHHKRFHFIRFESHIEAIYPAMDIVVIPSLSEEGFGMTALEGLIFGKPVVAYNSGGLNEIMHATGNSNYVVASGDIDGLVMRVSDLLSDQIGSEQVGFRNLFSVQSAFGIDKYRTELQQIIEDIQQTTAAQLPDPPPPPLVVQPSKPRRKLIRKKKKYSRKHRRAKRSISRKRRIMIRRLARKRARKRAARRSRKSRSSSSRRR